MLTVAPTASQARRVKTSQEPRPPAAFLPGPERGAWHVLLKALFLPEASTGMGTEGLAF